MSAAGLAALPSAAPAAVVPDSQRLFLAFDWGRKRTGVATGNRLTRSATAQSTLRAEGAAR